MKTPFKIGYGSIGWLLVPMVKIAREVHALGVEGIEGFGLTEMLLEDEQLAVELPKIGVRFIGSYFGASLVEPEALKYELDEFDRTLLKIAQLQGSVVAVGAGRIFPESRDRDWNHFIQAIKQMAGMAAARGVQLAYHPHDHTLVYEEQELARFLSDTKDSQVGITLDTAHFSKAHMDIYSQVKSLGSRLKHVHLKDLDRDGNFADLGKGMLDLRRFLQCLKDAGYAGWVTIEIDSTDDPFESARANVSHLKLVLSRLV